MGFLRRMNPFGKLSNMRQPTAEQLQAMSVLEAVGQVMICQSWDEATATFSRYSDELGQPDVEQIVDALKATFADDAYTVALIEEKAKLIAIHRTQGLPAILTHPPVKLKEPPGSLRLIARVGKMRSIEEAESSGKELIELMSRR
jgi:hypothetical protein